jgi:hypothetical protein
LLVAASGLLARTSAYPNARWVSDEGLELLGQCPTYGAQIGSVRSPVCGWQIARREWFETEDAMIEVYRWHDTKDQRWRIDLGTLHALLELNDVQPAAPVNGRTRFSVETRLSIVLVSPDAK